jgi:hypothetical protein
MFSFWKRGGKQQAQAQRITDGVYCVAASAEKDDDSHCDLVLNDNMGDTWHAGCHAPAWFEVDLGKQYDLSHINLMPYQVPTTCEAHHRVYAGAERDSMKLVAEVNQETRHHAWIKDVAVPCTDARYLKVETVKSDAWVAWSGLQIFGTTSK